MVVEERRILFYLHGTLADERVLAGRRVEGYMEMREH
jgi:hypothetical protein